VRSGEQRPADANDAIRLARLCLLYKRLPATAARLYEEAFAARPELASGRRPHRYDAVCAAVRAACGKEDDTKDLRESERARLRKQALGWLQAEQADRARQLEGGAPAARAAALAALRHWRRDPDLSGVRGDALSELPAAEGQAWLTLWAAVADALAKP